MFSLSNFVLIFFSVTNLISAIFLFHFAWKKKGEENERETEKKKSNPWHKRNVISVVKDWLRICLYLPVFDSFYFILFFFFFTYIFYFIFKSMSFYFILFFNQFFRLIIFVAAIYESRKSSQSLLISRKKFSIIYLFITSF